MVLPGDGGRESAQNLARDRHQQETEMKLENDNLAVRLFHRQVEMKKEKEERTYQDMEKEVGLMGMGNGDSYDWEKGEREELGRERENGTGDVPVEEIHDKDLAPVDDVCPICFDSFTIPCRSNCGHWFCATCILQFWMFRSSIQPCKCPLCCSRIVNLEPQTSQLIPQVADSVEVLKKVHQYNGLYIAGVFGAFLSLQTFPLFMGRIFQVLIDPDCFSCIYYVMRVLGLVLALLYERGEFEFLPTGGMGIQRMFDLGATLLIVVLFFIGMVYRWVLRWRVRRLAAIQAWDG